MKLAPLPSYLEDKYDSDSLVYINDSEFHYGTKVKRELLDDIFNNTLMFYSGYYTYHKNDDSPRLYYLGRGKESGKIKVKIQGYMPYCYDFDEKGEYNTYLGEKCEKLVFKGQHPSKVKKYREFRVRKGFKQPLEADILFHRRFACDVYDYFKPKKAVKPKIAIIDIETDYPVSDDIISYAVNDLQTGEIFYESKYDESTPKELTEHLIEHIHKYDIITGWNIEEFDKRIIEKKSNSRLHEIVSIVDLHGDAKKSICRNMYAKDIRGGWGLDNVGSRLCGIAKSLDEDDIKKDVRDLTPEKLMLYNCIDSIIPEIIDEYLGGLEAHLILAWSLQMGIDDVIITALVNDIALIREYHKAGVVLHSRHYDKQKTDEPKYKAADPDARMGAYHGIIETDIVAAYASAVIAINASVETMDKNGKYLAPNGIRFNDKHSTFIDTLKNLMIEKNKIKQRLKNVEKDTPEYKTLDFMHFAIKTQVAAFSHGIFGWGNSRMREYSVADAITSVLRELLGEIKSACDLTGNPWIYLHTDSCFILALECDIDRILKFLNDIINRHCKGYKIIPELEFKGYHPHMYIHAKARNVIVPKNIDIDDDENWISKGMSFLRSETPTPLGDIEIELIKLKLKDRNNEELMIKLKELLKELPNKHSRDLALSKPLNKPVKKYGRELQDGNWGGLPNHVKAIDKANKDYGLELVIGKKYGIIPIITNELVGVRKKKMKRVEIAFDLEDGMPSGYEINYRQYLDSNLWGKLHGMFGVRAKELEKITLTQDVKDVLNIKDLDGN